MSQVEIRERTFAYTPTEVAETFVDRGLVRQTALQDRDLSREIDDLFRYGYWRPSHAEDLTTVVVAIIKFGSDDLVMNDRDQRLALYIAAEKMAGELRVAIAKDQVAPEVRNFPWYQARQAERVIRLSTIIELQAKLLQGVTDKRGPETA